MINRKGIKGIGFYGFVNSKWVGPARYKSDIRRNYPEVKCIKYWDGQNLRDKAPVGELFHIEPIDFNW
jgi:hypothetical protein